PERWALDRPADRRRGLGSAVVAYARHTGSEIWHPLVAGTCRSASALGRGQAVGRSGAMRRIRLRPIRRSLGPRIDLASLNRTGEHIDHDLDARDALRRPVWGALGRLA